MRRVIWNQSVDQLNEQLELAINSVHFVASLLRDVNKLLEQTNKLESNGNQPLLKNYLFNFLNKLWIASFSYKYIRFGLNQNEGTSEF